MLAAQSPATLSSLYRQLPRTEHIQYLLVLACAELAIIMPCEIVMTFNDGGRIGGSPESTATPYLRNRVSILEISPNIISN